MAVSNGGVGTISVFLNLTEPAAPVADPARLTLASTQRFATTTVGDRTRVKRIRVTNTGGEAATGLRVSVIGGGRRDFQVLGAPAGTVPPSGSTAIRAVFRPKHAGTRRATLRITSSAATVSATLIGKGKAPRRLPTSPRF